MISTGRTLIWLTALALVLPAPAALRAAGAMVVEAVRLEGIYHVPDPELRRHLKLRPGAPCTPALVEADRKALAELGLFRSVTAHQVSRGTRVTVTFRLVEWPRVAHVRVLGNTVVEREAIQRALNTRVGEVLRPATLQADIAAIEALYRERGYVGRISESLLGEGAESGILRFEVIEVALGEVTVELPATTPRREAERLRRAALAALAERPPALYRPEALTADRERLRALKGVRAVAVIVENINPARVRVRWRLNFPETEPPPRPGPPAQRAAPADPPG